MAKYVIVWSDSTYDPWEFEAENDESAIKRFKENFNAEDEYGVTIYRVAEIVYGGQ